MKSDLSKSSCWSYFVEELNNKKLNLVTIPYGQVNDKLEFVFEILGSAESSVQVCNALDKTISNNAVVNVHDRTVVLKIDLSDLKPEIQIFEIRVLDASSSTKWSIDIAFTPLKQPLPDVTFVIGSPRSGTTAVGKLVQLGFDTKTHGESHVADIFFQMSKITETHFNSSPASKNIGTLTNELPFSFVYSQLVMNLRELYLRVYKGGAIIDKTPGIKMIECIPMLLKAFPNAKIIYCKRRGIENVLSRIRKFKKVPFEGHCKQWVRSINLWGSLKNSLIMHKDSSTRFLEIEQLELATNPDTVVSALIEFLALSKSKKQKLLNYLERNSPQKTGSSPKETFNFDEIDWTDERKSMFLDICGKTMEAQNYSLDEQYYVKTPV